MKRKILRGVAIFAMVGMLICTFCACANAKNKKAVATSGEYEIPFEQLRFLTMTYKAELDARYGDGNAENGTIWDDTETAEKHRAELEELVWGTVRENYAILQACAAYKIGREAFEGKEIEAAVDEQIAALIEEYPSKNDYLFTFLPFLLYLGFLPIMSMNHTSFGSAKEMDSPEEA